MITYFSYFCACLLFSPLLLHIAYRSCKTDYHTNDNNSNVTKHNRHNKSNQKKKKKKKKKEKNKEAKERMRRRTTTGTSRTRPRLQAWPQNQKDGRGTSPSPIFSAPLTPSATAGGPKWRSHFSSLTRGPMNGARCLAFDQGWDMKEQTGIQKNSLGVARTRSCPTKTSNDGPLAGKQGMRSYSVGQAMSWLGLKSTYRYF